MERASVSNVGLEGYASVGSPRGAWRRRLTAPPGVTGHRLRLMAPWACLVGLTLVVLGGAAPWIGRSELLLTDHPGESSVWFDFKDNDWRSDSIALERPKSWPGQTGFVVHVDERDGGVLEVTDFRNAPPESVTWRPPEAVKVTHFWLVLEEDKGARIVLGDDPPEGTPAAGTWLVEAADDGDFGLRLSSLNKRSMDLVKRDGEWRADSLASLATLRPERSVEMSGMQFTLAEPPPSAPIPWPFRLVGGGTAAVALAVVIGVLLAGSLVTWLISKRAHDDSAFGLAELDALQDDPDPPPAETSELIDEEPVRELMASSAAVGFDAVIEALRGWPDDRDAVMLAMQYAEQGMGSLGPRLAEETSQQWQARVALQPGPMDESLEDLISPYLIARFSRRPIGSDDRARALEALVALHKASELHSMTLVANGTM